ncbi:hypothetical protein RclHR1_03340006 [Rhizophagus clarus]|uniref:Uncharacterized protein n=1 Tax=Rhizophagus clarus TaxID=94130 RepID=A0A2Z6R990_9GLOM|nr:hypothetical protein RclHR1_03340006 [Rhizophagus clarus]
MQFAEHIGVSKCEDRRIVNSSKESYEYQSRFGRFIYLRILSFLDNSKPEFDVDINFDKTRSHVIIDHMLNVMYKHALINKIIDS